MKKIKSKQTTNPSDKPFDYEGFEKEAIGRLNGGASLVGPDGVLTGLIQRIVNAALSGEADSHIREEKAGGHANRRNGHTSKVLDTELGPVPISPPRDRAAASPAERRRTEWKSVADIRQAPSGALVEVRADDVAFEPDLRAWARQTGHAIVTFEAGPVARAVVQKA